MASSSGQGPDNRYTSLDSSLLRHYTTFPSNVSLFPRFPGSYVDRPISLAVAGAQRNDGVGPEVGNEQVNVVPGGGASANGTSGNAAMPAASRDGNAARVVPVAAAVPTGNAGEVVQNNGSSAQAILAATKAVVDPMEEYLNQYPVREIVPGDSTLAQGMRTVRHVQMRAKAPEVLPWAPDHRKWRIAEVFLKDVQTLADMTGQERAQLLMRLVDDRLRGTCELLVSEVIASGGKLTWEKAVEIFKHVAGLDLQQMREQAMHALVTLKVRQQSGQTVIEYACTLRQYLTRAKVVEPIQQCEYFITGLQPHLRDECMRTPEGKFWSNLNECILHAQGVEATKSRKSGGSVAAMYADPPVNVVAAVRTHSRFGSFVKRRKQDMSEEIVDGNKRRRLGYGGNEDRRHGDTESRGDRQCYLCGKTDHLIRDCPNNKHKGHGGGGRGGHGRGGYGRGGHGRGGYGGGRHGGGRGRYVH